jgi:S-DNA-T family DNA segregation ATPase FtsK/SpoIIIE
MLHSALHLSDELSMDDVTTAVAPPAAAVVPEGPAKPKTDRDIQRGALRDLIALAAECASTESEIEREYRTSSEQAKSGVSDRAFALDQRHVKAKEEAEQKHHEQITGVARQYKAQRNKIAAAEAAAREKAESEKQQVDAKLKKKYSDAVWLAESVLESANGQAALAYNTKRKQVETAAEDLSGWETQAAVLLNRYGLKLPTDPVDPPPDELEETDADAAFAADHAVVQTNLSRLKRMPLGNLFVGARPFLFWFLITALAVGGVFGWFYWQQQTTQPQWQPLGIFGGGTAVLVIGLLVFLRVVATKQIRAVHDPLRVAAAAGRRAADRQLVNAAEKLKADQAAALAARNAEVQASKDQVTPVSTKAAQARNAAVEAAKAETGKQLAKLDATKLKMQADVDAALAKQLVDLDHKLEQDHKANKAKHEATVAAVEERRRTRQAELEARWSSGLAEIQAPIGESDESAAMTADFSDPAWTTWKPGKKFATRVRFGKMQVDLTAIAENVPKRLNLPATFSLPALLAFPAQSSLLIHTDHAGRPDALKTLQAVMTRLLVTQPAGRVRFTIIDPVGLGQNFAGFMHLTDYDDALVGGRIWTSQDQIDTRLTNLADHMETVIQKYLRNEFATIDDYNAQAGELAEPYRFLVIADLPTNFSAEAFRRLNSIASSGARCGVYTLISRDIRAGLPAGANLDELKLHSVNLIRKDDKFVWDDDVFRQLPLVLDTPPTDETMSLILHKVGQGAKDAKRVEVPFETIAPKKGEEWTGSTTSELDVMVGRLGANRFQSLKLGKGVSQHVLIAGKTGSGKSTLMHAMIVNAAMWYSPDEVELYLIDFKKGVEFKTYATNLLPHARAIAVESDREFGLSLLTRLDVELARRGELFRKAAVQDLKSYRASANPTVVPRTLLIIDEFQEFFTEDDKTAQEAALLIERLVRQGRAFGMHVLLGSQTIGGAGGLPRAVLAQFGVRIALQTSEADSQMILGDNNSAARLLTRPGEAIYNDANGAVEGNSPFQVAYLSDAKRDVYLKDLASKAKPYFERFGYPIVFEGNAAAEIQRNAKFNAVLNAPNWPATLGSAGALGWLGDPVAIKDPSAIQFRRQAGLNVLVVGQAEEQSLAMLSTMLVGFAAQQSPAQASFYVMDGSAVDSPFAGTFEKVKAALPHDVRMVDFRKTDEAINEIAEEVARRQAADEGGPSIYVFIYALQRYRALRKSEDDYSSFSSIGDDAPKKANTGKQFAEILKEGPTVGVHVICWIDTNVNIDRTFDRGVMREFDNRVLFQMSASDSSNLIDSPSANKLGYHRALVYSEEQGSVERFRPYALPETAWLAEVHQKLAARAT